VGRTPNDHVTFGGGGVHYCLGANLARTQIRAVMHQLVDRMDNLELAGPARRLRSDFVNGIKELPLRFTPR
jgi:cholest-4-en-3-one 26-monooxygenase